MKNILLTIQMIKYNVRIIFGNKLLYFLIASFLIFIAIVVGNLAAGETLWAEDGFTLLLFIGVLIVFYPITYAIQSDKDARTLEIIFGIPDYRYRVWLLRLGMVFLLAFVMLILLGFLLQISLIEAQMFSVIMQVMYPLVFLGTFTFLITTLVKSGNAAAVIIIIICMALLISSEFFENKYYNVFFNPLAVPDNTNQIVWEGLTLKNHIFLVVGGLISLLGGLYNLQGREKFLG